MDQERDREPDALLQGPRRLGRARAGRRAGLRHLACASTGNLAGAVAAHAAYAGLPAYVFIPADLEAEKILSAGAYGAQLIGVRGNYDDVNRLCTEVSGERKSWAFVNVNVRPYYAEGSKTLAYETAEQLGWELPDRVVAPIASGSLFTKVARGFEEFIEAGLAAASVPVMNGAQAEGCSPVAQAFEAGADFCRPVKPDTIASRWRSATRPTARMRSSSPAAPAAPSTRSPTTRSARASGCSPRRPASSPRPPAA